jgi:thioredoxin 1
MAEIEILNDSNFVEMTKSGVILVDFYADWCGPCRMIHPILVELAGEFSGRAKIAKVNVDHSQALASEHGITSIPTLLLFKDGKIVEHIVGLRDKKSLVDLIQSHA